MGFFYFGIVKESWIQVKQEARCNAWHFLRWQACYTNTNGLISLWLHRMLSRQEMRLFKCFLRPFYAISTYQDTTQESILRTIKCLSIIYPAERLPIGLQNLLIWEETHLMLFSGIQGPKMYPWHKSKEVIKADRWNAILHRFDGLSPRSSVNSTLILAWAPMADNQMGICIVLKCSQCRNPS